MLKVNFKKLISVFLVAALLSTQVTFAFATEANEEYSESTESIEVHEHEHEHEHEEGVDESIELFDEESDEEIFETEDEAETEAEVEESEAETETKSESETEAEVETEIEVEDEESEAETETEERNEELENEETIEENKDEEDNEEIERSDVARSAAETADDELETDDDEIEVEIIDGEIFESNKKAEKGKGTETETQTQEETETETETETEPEPAPDEIAETVEAKIAKTIFAEVTWNGFPDLDPPCAEQIEVSFTPYGSDDILAIYVDGQQILANGERITTTETRIINTKSNGSVQLIVNAQSSATTIKYIPQRIAHTTSYQVQPDTSGYTIFAECPLCGKAFGEAYFSAPDGVVADLNPAGTKPFADPTYDSSWTGSPLIVEYFNNTAVGDANDPDVTKRPTCKLRSPDGSELLHTQYFTIVNPPPAPVPSGGGNSGGGGGGGGTTFDPFTVKPNVTYSLHNKNSLYITNASTSHWNLNILGGKRNLTLTNELGQAVPAVNGFYQVDTTTNMIVNNIETPVTHSDIYYFDEFGNAVTGWVHTPDGNSYFFNNERTDNECKIVTGWRVIEGKLHYFNPDGTLLRNGIAPDGRAVDAEGKLITLAAA